jgi:hypothetical protein
MPRPFNAFAGPASDVMPSRRSLVLLGHLRPHIGDDDLGGVA